MQIVDSNYKDDNGAFLRFSKDILGISIAATVLAVIFFIKNNVL